MKKFLFIPFAILVLLCIAGPAWALDMEYYTYGGFNPIVQAFQKVALIFSDSEYQGLLYVVMVLGILAGAVAWMAKAANGARIAPWIFFYQKTLILSVLCILKKIFKKDKENYAYDYTDSTNCHIPS